MRHSKFVLQETAGNQGLGLEKKPHRKVEEISCTFLPVRVGALGPALGTARPVIGSRMVRTFFQRILRGLGSVPPPSTLASGGSPGRSPGLLRMPLERTT
jgi:hypothetical protein